MTSASMWTYWRDKYGYIRALRDYYDMDLGTSEDHAAIFTATSMIIAGEKAIDQIMEERADNEEEEDT